MMAQGYAKAHTFFSDGFIQVHSRADHCCLDVPLCSGCCRLADPSTPPVPSCWLPAWTPGSECSFLCSGEGMHFPSDTCSWQKSQAAWASRGLPKAVITKNHNLATQPNRADSFTTQKPEALSPGVGRTLLLPPNPRHSLICKHITLISVSIVTWCSLLRGCLYAFCFQMAFSFLCPCPSVSPLFRIPPIGFRAHANPL